MRSRVTACLWIVGILTLGGTARGATTRFDSVPQIPPAWRVTFTAPVLWQRVTTLGHLVAATETGVHGMDPASGRVTWTRTDMPNLAEEGFEEIADTSLIVLGKGQERGRVLIIDAADGRGVFDSRAAGFSGLHFHRLLPRAGGLLIAGPKNQGIALAMIDPATGRIVWENTTALAGAARPATPSWVPQRYRTVEAPATLWIMEQPPVELGGESFLLGTELGVLRISSRTGEVAWKTESMLVQKGMRIFVNPKRPDRFYVGADSGAFFAALGGQPGAASVDAYYMAYRLADGRDLWPKPVDAPGTVTDAIVTDRGLILSGLTQGVGRIKLIDENTGQSLWGKKGRGIEVKGGIVDHDFSRAGLVLTTGFDSAWNDRGTEYLLNVLDVSAGAFRFNDPVKVRGRILQTEALPGAVLYVTTTELGLLDLVTGRPLAKPVVSENTLVTARRGDSLFAFSADDGMLYRVDLKQATLRPVSDRPLKFEDRDAPIELVATPEGLSLAGQQHLAAFAPDGRVRFHTHYPAPRLPAIVRALLRAQQVRAVLGSVASGVMTGAFAMSAAQQKDGTGGQALSASVAEGYGQVAQSYAGAARKYAEAARTRFSATTTAPGFVFMMVQFTREDYGLARVSRATGQIEGMVNMQRDKEPVYDVDAVTNRLYYRQTPTEVVAFYW